jgi:hypothetical protein
MEKMLRIIQFPHKLSHYSMMSDCPLRQFEFGFIIDEVSSEFYDSDNDEHSTFNSYEICGCSADVIDDEIEFCYDGEVVDSDTQLEYSGLDYVILDVPVKIARNKVKQTNLKSIPKGLDEITKKPKRGKRGK